MNINLSTGAPDIFPINKNANMIGHKSNPSKEIEYYMFWHEDDEPEEIEDSDSKVYISYFFNDNLDGDISPKIYIDFKNDLQILRLTNSEYDNCNNPIFAQAIANSIIKQNIMNDEWDIEKAYKEAVEAVKPLYNYNMSPYTQMGVESLAKYMSQYNIKATLNDTNIDGNEIMCEYKTPANTETLFIGHIDDLHETAMVCAVDMSFSQIQKSFEHFAEHDDTYTDFVYKNYEHNKSKFIPLWNKNCDINEVNSALQGLKERFNIYEDRSIENVYEKFFGKKLQVYEPAVSQNMNDITKVINDLHNEIKNEATEVRKADDIMVMSHNLFKTVKAEQDKVQSVWNEIKSQLPEDAKADTEICTHHHYNDHYEQTEIRTLDEEVQSLGNWHPDFKNCSQEEIKESFKEKVRMHHENFGTGWGFSNEAVYHRNFDDLLRYHENILYKDVVNDYSTVPPEFSADVKEKYGAENILKVYDALMTFRSNISDYIHELKEQMPDDTIAHSIINNITISTESKTPSLRAVNQNLEKDTDGIGEER